MYVEGVLNHCAELRCLLVYPVSHVLLIILSCGRKKYELEFRELILCTFMLAILSASLYMNLLGWVDGL